MLLLDFIVFSCPSGQNPPWNFFSSHLLVALSLSRALVQIF